MLVKYNPLRELLNFDEPLFPHIFKDPTWKESRDFETFGIKSDETDDYYIIRVNAAGYEKEEVKVEIVEGVIHIRAEKKKEGDNGWIQGKHARSFTLPENIDVDRIKGELKNGVLTIEIPKRKREIKLIEID